MDNRPRVSLAVVKRLPKYYRYLGLISDRGIIRVSSQELSKITGLTASQIRQDLNHFGGFGQQGYGYNVEELKLEIEKIIGIDKSYKAIVLGMGNIGQAIYKYRGFNEDSGFKIVGLFDRDKNLIGKTILGKKIQDVKNLEGFLKEQEVDIAVLATTADSAQELCDILVDGKVKGIWNFASLDLKLPKNVVLENVHLDESLFTLTYYLNNLKDYPGTKN
ncbi:redox-sensing transcriptional repressor Rex [Lagierella sp.]|uniref:redox-sensing transcriptional repressor Rex n=1 Tax=Lagierella sp. TaxID=2849657 RepID=UPI00261E72D5|nr:redox-sensing transcriptional repressor Rex [Lagierella sp.]